MKLANLLRPNQVIRFPVGTDIRRHRTTYLHKQSSIYLILEKHKRGFFNEREWVTIYPLELILEGNTEYKTLKRWAKLITRNNYIPVFRSDLLQEI